MNINTWGIIHIIAAFLCLLGMLVFKQKKGFPRHVYIVFCAITVMHILGFLWHSVDNHFLPNALLLFDIFSMLCFAGAAMFFYWSIDNLYHKVLKPDAAGDISGLDMNSVESAENCYVFKCEKLYVIFPRYSKIKYSFQKCPSMKDESLTFFANATFFKQLSFTFFVSSALFGKVNPRFHQLSVLGNHAQDGIAYKGAQWHHRPPNAFTFYDGQAHFVFENADDAIKLAAEKGGDGFEGCMVIWDGKKIDFLAAKKRCYRVLTELNGRVCIIESSIAMSYDEFIQSVLDIGVQKALYLDMGGKSAYSQYRDNRNHVINLFSRYPVYFSGWIAFYK